MFIKENFPSNINTEKLAKKQKCTSLEMVLSSDLVCHLIHISSKKTQEILDTGKEKKNVVNIYISLIDEEPITLKDKKYLLEFLSDENSTQIAQSIFSQLHIGEGDKNNALLEEYFKDTQGKLTIEKILPIMIEMVAKYPYVIDIDGEIKAKIGSYYMYVLNNGNSGICIKNEESFYCLPETFTAIEVLENEVIVGYTQNNQANRSSEKIAKIYKFENDEFKNIGNIPGGENIIFFDENTILFSQGGNKYGLIKFEKKENGSRDFKTLLAPIYDIIEKRSMLIACFIESKNDTSEGILSLHKENNIGMKQFFSGNAINNTNVMRFLDRLGKIFSSIQFITDNYLKIETKDGTDVYYYDDKKEELTLVESLQSIKQADYTRLFEGKLTFIYFKNGLRGQFIFSPETQELKCLIEYKSKDIYNEDVKKYFGDKLEIDAKGGKVRDLIIYKNEKIFMLKNGYKLVYKRDKITGEYKNYIKKGFFGEKFYLNDYTYEELEKYLEEVNPTLVIK